MVSWKEWLARHPETLALVAPSARDPRGDIYAAYHRSRDLGVTGRLRASGRPDPKSRIVGFRLDGRAYAVTLRAITETPIVLTRVSGGGVVVAASRDGVGARVFRAGIHRLTLAARGRQLTDVVTASTWDAISGTAIAGPLRGTVLEEIPAHPAYWFAWRAFYPNSEWITPP